MSLDTTWYNLMEVSSIKKVTKVDRHRPAREERRRILKRPRRVLDFGVSGLKKEAHRFAISKMSISNMRHSWLILVIKEKTTERTIWFEICGRDGCESCRSLRIYMQMKCSENVNCNLNEYPYKWLCIIVGDSG